MAVITTEAALRLGDSTHSIWPAAELQRYCKDGYAKICRETLCLWFQTYINDRAGQSDYDLPSDFIVADRATWNNKPLVGITEHALNEIDHQYRNEDITGEPTHYYADGVSTLRKYPPPTTTITSTALSFPTTATVLNFRLEYFRLGASLDSNAFEIPDSWTKVVRHYIMFKAYSKHCDGYNKTLAKHFGTRWEMDLADLKATGSIMGSIRRVIMGGNSGFKQGRRPPDARLPWRYGRTVRG